MKQEKGISIDQECILGNAVKVIFPDHGFIDSSIERCVWDVIKRPRYFQWTEQIGLASGLSKRHPYRGNHGQ